ncbi:hypothetical protein EDB86DRAFT_3150100 [Lactarius hatsudake]|nr:hypothetical protein EDB86DRAFT_3150100 [Lactarius hatsudake]
MGSEVHHAAAAEACRLKQIPPQNAERGFVRTYLEWLISLPWTPPATASDTLTRSDFLTNFKSRLDVPRKEAGTEQAKAQEVTLKKVIDGLATGASEAESPKENTCKAHIKAGEISALPHLGPASHGLLPYRSNRTSSLAIDRLPFLPPSPRSLSPSPSLAFTSHRHRLPSTPTPSQDAPHPPKPGRGSPRLVPSFVHRHPVSFASPVSPIAFKVSRSQLISSQLSLATFKPPLEAARSVALGFGGRTLIVMFVVRLTRVRALASLSRSRSPFVPYSSQSSPPRSVPPDSYHPISY